MSLIIDRKLNQNQKSECAESVALNEEDDEKPVVLTYEEKRRLAKEKRDAEVKELLAKVKADSSKSLVPQETDEEVISSLSEKTDDEDALKLFQMIHVKSFDVNFTWQTGMLMNQIIGWAADAESLQDFERSLSYFDSQHKTTLLQDRCKPYLNVIFEMGQKLK